MNALIGLDTQSEVERGLVIDDRLSLLESPHHGLDFWPINIRQYNLIFIASDDITFYIKIKRSNSYNVQYWDWANIFYICCWHSELKLLQILNMREKHQIYKSILKYAKVFVFFYSKKICISSQNSNSRVLYFSPLLQLIFGNYFFNKKTLYSQL